MGCRVVGGGSRIRYVILGRISMNQKGVFEVWKERYFYIVIDFWVDIGYYGFFDIFLIVDFFSCY